MDSLKFIKALTWQDVFSLWREGEAKFPRWIEHYSERGFASWDEWRKHTIKDLACENLDRKLFEVEKPLESVPKFFGGPFRPWAVKYYGNATTLPFAEIIKNEELQKSQMVQEIVQNFAPQTSLIGLKTSTGIVILEGMHRCCALTLASLQGKDIKPKVFIALASFDGELPLLGSATSPT